MCETLSYMGEQEARLDSLIVLYRLRLQQAVNSLYNLLVPAGVPGRQMARHCSSYRSAPFARESTSTNGVCFALL